MRVRRLSGRDAFGRLFEEGERIEQGSIRIVYLVDQPAEPAVHVAFICPSGRYPAVRRNRVRRLMKEAFVKERADLLRRFDSADGAVLLAFVFRGLRGRPVERLKLQTVREDIAAGCRRIKVGGA